VGAIILHNPIKIIVTMG